MFSSPAPPPSDPAPPKPPLWRLSLGYALAFTTGPITITVSPLLGRQAAADPAWSTLPLAVQMVAMMAAGIPASLLMERVGRRRGFQTAMIIGVIGTALIAFSADRFWLLVAGSICMGLMLGAAQLFRFAASDMAPTRRSEAVSRVLVGGVAASIVGPGIVFAITRWTPWGLTGAFVAVTALILSAIILMEFIPFAPVESRTASRPPLRDFARRPLIVGVGAAALGYGTMSVLMSATPLAMADIGYSVEATSAIIMLHGVAMFAPSFWTGRFIARYGSGKIMLTGWAMLIGAYAVSLSSTAPWGFAIALVLLGIGWNGMFVAGTAMVATDQRPGEGARLQGINDLFVIGSAAAGSLLSGALIATVGWGDLQVWILALLVIVGVALAAIGRRLPTHRPSMPA